MLMLTPRRFPVLLSPSLRTTTKAREPSFKLFRERALTFTSNNHTNTRKTYENLLLFRSIHQISISLVYNRDLYRHQNHPTAARQSYCTTPALLSSDSSKLLSTLIMAASATQNPPVKSESKSAKKKKAKNVSNEPEASTPPVPESNNPAESNSGDGSYESPYIKELEK